MNNTIKDVTERDDVKQYVQLELIKAYKNHKKYADWRNIVLSIIKRRIFDYRKRLRKNPLWKYQAHTDGEENAQDRIDRINLDHGNINADATSRYEKTDTLETIWYLVGENEHLFTSWDLDYIGALYDAYDDDRGFETEIERMKLMGVDNNSKAEVKVFRKSVKKFIKTVKKVMYESKVD